MWREYAADDPGRPDQPDTHATPSVAPATAPRLDPVELVVDGQRFIATRRAGSAGTYDFDWVNHPGSYGFTIGASSEWRPDRAEMTEEIRSFLAQVDPETGFLPD